MTIAATLARIPVPIRQQLAAQITEWYVTEEEGELEVPIVISADDEKQALFHSGYCIALLRLAELLDPSLEEL